MATARFVANLRPQTVEIFDAAGYRPEGWLLSSHRLNRRTAALAEWAREKGYDLFADNGAKDDIEQVIDLHRAAQEPLRHRIRDLRRSLGRDRRIPWPREVSAGLRRDARRAARDVVSEVERVLDARPPARILDEQLSMDPTHLIAPEDITNACLIGLGLEREITGWTTADYRARARITVDRWEAARSDPRCRDVRVYATLGAPDYNAARSVAAMFARAGIDRVAFGFAGVNLDATALDVFWCGNRRALAVPAPRRHVRTAEVLFGIRDGYRDERRRLRGFHALGLGSRAQLTVLAASMDWYTDISVDAMSAVYDAVRDRTLYSSRGWGDRIGVLEGAQSVLAGSDPGLRSTFLRRLRRSHGHSPGDARAWWESVQRRDPTLADLAPAEPLGTALPVFATARGGSDAEQSRARTGHNHAVVDDLMGAIPSSRRADWGREAIATVADQRTGPTRRGLLAAGQIATTAGE